MLQNISKINTQCLLVQISVFQHFRHNIYNQEPKLMGIFSSNYSLELYLPKFLGPCDFLPFFLINVFQKKSLLLREGLQKSCIWLTLCLLIHGLTSSSCGWLWPRLFLPFGQKKGLLFCLCLF